MPETISISIDADRFDEILHDSGCPPEMGDLELVVKPEGTHGGHPVVTVTFSVVTEAEDGVAKEKRRVQAVTTLRALLTAADALRSHPDLELPT